MAKVTLTTKVLVGKKIVPKKLVLPFFSIVAESYMNATAVQLRKIAYASKDLIVDKLLARPITKGNPVIFRKNDEKISLKEPEFQRPDETELEEEPIQDLIIIPASTSSKRRQAVAFSHVPLNKFYLTEKIRKGLDPRILLATGDYIKGIVVRRKKSDKAGIYYVLTLANRKHKSSNLPLQKLARIHEYGTDQYTIHLFGNTNLTRTVSIPARPHWRPIIGQLKKEFKNVSLNIKIEALELILNRLR